ncbi:uncharacterized protein LOC143901837 isoform X4 [Temnothorax americanus]|uniref:uncharacterized protein LOC143901837 isoform X4 n=1 Tax=Temnothorax americanus TaxID=1964332 RepID=UPI0040685DE3
MLHRGEKNKERSIIVSRESKLTNRDSLRRSLRGEGGLGEASDAGGTTLRIYVAIRGRYKLRCCASGSA